MDFALAATMLSMKTWLLLFRRELGSELGISSPSPFTREPAKEPAWEFPNFLLET